MSIQTPIHQPQASSRSYSLRRVLISVFLIAAGFRLFIFCGLLSVGGAEELLLGDSTRYLSLAESVLAGDGFSYRGFPEAYRPPGYPSFLLLFRVIGAPLWSASIIQIVIGSFVAVMAAYLAWRFFDVPRWLVFLIGAVVALEPGQAFYDVTLMPDAFFNLSFITVIFLLARYLESFRWEDAVCAGLVVGVANYFRPAGLYLVFALAAAVVAVAMYQRRWSWKVGVSAIALIGCTVLVAVPWSIRNYHQFGSVSFVSAGPYNFFIYAGVSSVAVGEGREYAEVKKDFIEMLRRDAPDPGNQWSLRNESYFLSTAVAAIRAHPFGYLKGYLLGLNTLFFSGNYQYLLSRYDIVHMPEKLPSFSLVLSTKGLNGLLSEISRLSGEPYLWVAIISKLFWLTVVLLSLVGAWVRRNSPLAVLFACSVVYFAVSILSTALGVEARHRHSLNPLIFLFAGAVIYLLYEKVVGRRACL